MDENRRNHRVFYRGESSTSSSTIDEHQITLSLFPSSSQTTMVVQPQQQVEPPQVVEQPLPQQESPPPLLASPPHASGHQTQRASTRSRSRRQNRNRDRRTNDIPQQYAWATNKRATLPRMDYLLSQGISIISGDVQCKKCRSCFQIEFDLQKEFMKVMEFIVNARDSMHDRAPAEWMSPALPNCSSCSQKNCLKPVINQKKKAINWLFLFLGQMLGCCSLAQLKYFCKYTDNHRTGAKDRLVYLAYMCICRQLDPTGPYVRP